MQNIIELGFSPDISQEKQKIIQYLNEVYKAAQKLDGLRIELKFTNSAGDFRKVVKDLEETYKNLTQTINAYNDMLKEAHANQQKVAEAEKKSAAAKAATAQASQQAAKSVGELNTAYGGLLGTIEESLGALRQLKGALSENLMAQKNLATSFQAGNITVDQYNTKLVELEKQEKLLGQAVKQMNLYITSQTKELIAQEDSYDQLNAKLLQLERTWKTLSKTDRESQIGVNLQKEVAAARAELTKLDATIGNHQRKVGNYAGAWNGLGNSVNQLTRELPAFANSIQTGLMGISNNIPILADEIKRIRLENKALRLEGKPTESVLAQLGKSFLSWNTLLSVGVTLLVVYGKEIFNFIGTLIKGKEAIDKLKISQESLNKALESADYKSAIKSVQDLTVNIDLAKKGFIKKEDVVKQYNKTLGKSTGEVTDFNDVVEKTNKLGPKYVEVMLYMAAANIALDEAAKKAYETEQLRRKKLEEYETGLDRMSLHGLRTRQQVEAQEARIAENEKKRKAQEVKDSQDAENAQLDIVKTFREKAAKIAKENSINLFPDPEKPGGTSNYQSKVLAAQKKGNEARLQQQAQFNKDLSEQEGLGYSARQGFLKKYFEIEQQIIAENAKYDLQKAGLTNDEKLAIQEEAASKSLALTSKYLSDNAKLQEKADADAKAQLAKDLENMKSYEQKHGKELEALKFKQRDDDARLEISNGQSRLQDLTTRYNKEQAALTESLNKKEITQTEYAQKMLASQREYAAEAIKMQIATAEKAADLTTDPQQYLDLQNKISGLKKAYEDFVKETKENPLPKWQVWAQEMLPYVERVAEALKNVSNAFNSIVNVSFDNQKTELEELAQKSDDNYSKEQENIANSVLSEEDKANKLKVLEAKHDAQKQQIEKRQKQADNERAQFNKQLSIVNIITSTAEAIMKTLAQGGWFALPLTYTIAAVGAAELAAVVATKVPQYAEGTEDHPGGPAIVGEGKDSELVITPDGKMSVVSKPAFLDLPKHSQVIPLSQEYKSQLPGAQIEEILKLSNAKSNDQWDIAAWQIKMLTKAYKEANQGNKTRIQNNIKVDLGWYNYIQRNTQGL